MLPGFSNTFITIAKPEKRSFNSLIACMEIWLKKKRFWLKKKRFSLKIKYKIYGYKDEIFLMWRKMCIGCTINSFESVFDLEVFEKTTIVTQKPPKNL